ncbi:hypothetical protein Chor_002544 [Crotalus horridus]
MRGEKAEVCVERATARCSILLSNLFYECHQVIPPNTFYATCEENNCFGEEVCEIVASYAHLCKLLKTWIPSIDPCKVCMCLENRTVNCVPQPCATAKLCDLISCKLPLIPHCEDGLQLIQTNPGGCRPDYACVCKKEECKPQSTPFCPPHRKPVLVKTRCCDEFQCVCSCNNSTVTCPPGYLSSSVCVHRNIVYPLGMTWEEGCKECSCTHMKDAVTGLRITECVEKGCSTSCPAGYKYVNREGACCGKCLRTMCEDKPLWSRRDEDVVWHNVRHCEPVNGCVLNGTVLAPGKRMLLDECTTCQCTTRQGLFLTYKLTCGKITCEPCPKNYRMEKTSGSCCGKCLPTRCDIQLRDGTILYLKPNETIQDGCDNHFCKVNQKGDFIWERKITGCPPFDSKKCLAEGGKVTKLGNTCCETCVYARDPGGYTCVRGVVMGSHAVDIMTSILIRNVHNCCISGVEPECKLATGRLEFVKVDDCVNENQLNLHYCEGKCSSQAIYNITLNRIEDLCSCCSATAADTMRVPLRCANGSLVHHQVFNARECDCLSRKCQP